MMRSVEIVNRPKAWDSMVTREIQAGVAAG